MTAINRAPRGLQSLLDTKSLGVNPSELGQVVSPTLDLTDFFYSETLLQGEEGTQVAGIGDFGQYLAPVEIPLGETWAVKAVSSTSILQVGASQPGTHSVIPVIRPATRTTLQIPLTSDRLAFGNLTATEAFVVTRIFERPLVVGNGAQFASWWHAGINLTGNFTQFTQIAYYKLKT